VNKVYDKNLPILEELIEKRQELAKMLNYSSFADYHIKKLMAKNASTVEAFEENLARKVIPSARKEFLRM